MKVLGKTWTELRDWAIKDYKREGKVFSDLTIKQKDYFEITEGVWNNEV